MRLTTPLFLIWLLWSPATLFGQDLDTAVLPEDVGLSSERLNRLTDLARQYVDEDKYPGVLALVARRGQVAYVQATGFMDLERREPLRVDALFRLASMTKPVVSVALMQLYEQGAFQLGDPISDYLPEFTRQQVLSHPAANPATDSLHAAKRPTTVGQILSHTGGFAFGYGSTKLDVAYRASVNSPANSLETLTSELAKLPLAYQPGESWLYSTSVDVVARLVEVLSGQPLDTYLAEQIFAPLGMDDTAYYVPEDKLDRLTTLYGINRQNGVLSALDGPPRSVVANPNIQPRGTAGLVSTLEDYLTFCQALLHGGEWNGSRIIGRKTLELMTQDHLPKGVRLPSQYLKEYPLDGYGFGLGFRIRTDVAASQMLGSVGEYGWAGAHETYFFVDPSEDLIGIVFTQASPSAFYPLRRQFTTMVYQALTD